VLLPEMANRIATGDERGARHAQNRAVELTLLLAIPCLVAFLLVPDLIMRALFGRGAFTDADARAAGATLAAYAIGLFPFVLMRSVTVTFLARGDTVTPVKALAVAVAVNVALKILLMGSHAQVGLAFATSIGAWVNFALLLWFASRKELITIDDRLKRSVVKLAVAGLALAAAIIVGERVAAGLFSEWRALRAEATLALLALIGAVVYFGVVLALFGKQWLAALRRRPPPGGPPPGTPVPPPD
jgi:putative peptidoglycan lipid II flippase